MSTAFVDFQTLKQQVSIGQVCQMLGLKLITKGPQSRGACPACNQGGDRALAVNADKASFYCFSQKAGGDSIALVAHIRSLSQRDAANLIATHFRFAGGTSDTSGQSTTSRTSPPAPKVRPSFDAEAYLKGLDPEQEQLKSLGVSPETLCSFRSGYSKTGVLKGRLALALCDRDGNILGFAGRALDSPALTFPNGINPADIIFGADKVPEGEVRLVKEPLDVLQAYEVGEPAVCWLTENVEPQQLEQMASLLDARKAKLFF